MNVMDGGSDCESNALRKSRMIDSTDFEMLAENLLDGSLSFEAGTHTHTHNNNSNHIKENAQC